MSKKPPPGQCVYCLKEYKSLTWDHVFPKSWYPKATDPRLEKWKVPACVECNKDHGKNEEDLLIRIGLCFNPKDPIYGDIAKKAMRALKPEMAKNETDRHHRQMRREKIKKEIVRMNSLPPYGILPNFGPQSQINGPIGTIPVHEDSLKKLCRKIVRGLTYRLDGRYIADDYVIDIYIPDEAKVQEVVKLIEKWGKKHYRGPGLEITRAIPVDDDTAQLLIIMIFKRLRLHASVIRKE
jgi:hypothetical protein